jgi:ArsR family transcriptional regulator
MSKPDPMESDTIAAAAEMLRAVAHPIRLRVIAMLEDGKDHSVSEIQEALGVRQSVASTQLALLRDRGILSARRDGVQVYYSIVNRAAVNVIRCIRRNQQCFDKPRYV